MGLFDYFSKEAAAERKKARCLKKLTNMYYQSPDRLAAADQVAEMIREGDKSSISILLARFEHMTPSKTIDSDEKQYILDLFVDLGDHAEDGVIDYIKKTSKPVYWPMKVIEKRWSKDKYRDFVADVLENEDADYTRDPTKKAGLMQIAKDHPSERIALALVPFAGDQDETVRFHAVDAILGFEFDAVRPGLVERLADEESNRILNKLVEMFAERHWELGEHAAAVEENLPEGFAITGKGTISRRAS